MLSYSVFYLTLSLPNLFTVASAVQFTLHLREIGNYNFFLYGLLSSIQVQNLIERCLQLYMNQKEVVETLLDQAKIEPGFTELGNGNFCSLAFFFHFYFTPPSLGHRLLMYSTVSDMIKFLVDIVL